MWVLEIKPMPRGGGFKSDEKGRRGSGADEIYGRSGRGLVDGLLRGRWAFGHEVHVTLTTVRITAVDSSDLAFRTRRGLGRQAKGYRSCQPVAVEPIHVVEIVCPTDATARSTPPLGSGARQILGFDTRRRGRDGTGFAARMPRSREIGELIVSGDRRRPVAGSF